MHSMEVSQYIPKQADFVALTIPFAQALINTGASVDLYSLNGMHRKAN